MTASSGMGRVGGPSMVMASRYSGYMKATFGPSHDSKATFMYRKYTKVAFMNLAADEPADREEPS